MAPDLIDTMEARELVQLGRNVREYQLAKGLSDSAMIRRFPGLGSTKTYTRICADDLAELDLERQLHKYRAVWALIESLGEEKQKADELYDDLMPVLQLKRAVFETMRETGNARLVLMEGDTGTGKSSAKNVLVQTYGQRLLWIEATDVWKDNPSAMLGAILTALGKKEVPTISVERLNRVVAALNETRICVIIDEAHHLGQRCLNTVKTLVNQTPGEFVLLAMPTLWKRLEREAYEEVRQLVGNRLAERIKLDGLQTQDVEKLIRRRVPGCAEAGLERIVRLLLDRAPRYGNFAFVRDVITRVVELSEGTTGPDIECWTTAIMAEVQSR